MTTIKSIDIVFEVGGYHSWPNTQPLQVEYWGSNTLTSGLDPSTRSIPSKFPNSQKEIRKIQ